MALVLEVDMQSWNPVPTSTSYRDAAIETARWIRAAGRPTAHGLTWLPDPDRPDVAATISSPNAIYSGGAGVVLFFLELAGALGDPSYLDDARRGADQLAAAWRETLSQPAMLAIPGIEWTFFQGLPGIAFTLAEVARVTGDASYRDAAREVVAAIVAAARADGHGPAWVGAPSAGLGDGSVVLFLLWAATALDDPTLRDLAVQAGERILAEAEPDGDGGLRWQGFPTEKIGLPAGTYFPNFEFGTAGVAFVLARLFAATGDPRFLDAARAGARHVAAIATVRDDAALLFYRDPGGEDLYYLGYCHGPVGTARLFALLADLVPEAERAEYETWLARFARGIPASGVPERRTPGLWNVVCQCCGTAGILDFFVSLWLRGGDRADLDYAERVAANLLARADNPDGAGLRWYQAWTRVRPDEVAAETGYMIGAAGVGSAFLHLHLALEGRYEAILFPDNPFPTHA